MTSKSFENEFIEIYDFNGQKTGEKALKSVVHKNGLHHSTVHLWIYTISGEVLIQKRSLNKILNPGVWDVSVAGHIHFDETYNDAVIRETLEETGINIESFKLYKLGVYHSKSIHDKITDNEFHHTYVLEIKKELINIGFKNDEVEELKLIPIKEMESLVCKGLKNYFIGKNKDYYFDVISEIKKRTTKNYL